MLNTLYLRYFLFTSILFGISFLQSNIWIWQKQHKINHFCTKLNWYLTEMYNKFKYFVYIFYPRICYKELTIFRILWEKIPVVGILSYIYEWLLPGNATLCTSYVLMQNIFEYKLKCFLYIDWMGGLWQVLIYREIVNKVHWFR